MKKSIAYILVFIMVFSLVPPMLVNAAGMVSLSNVLTAATALKAYVETYHSMPETVTVGSEELTPAQYVKIAGDAVMDLYEGNTVTSYEIEEVLTPQNPVDDVAKTFKMYRDAEAAQAAGVRRSYNYYCEMLGRCSKFIEDNAGLAPNYCVFQTNRNTTYKVGFFNLVYLGSRALAYYDANGRLPNYVEAAPWSEITSGSTTPSVTVKPTAKPTPVPTIPPTPRPTEVPLPTEAPSKAFSNNLFVVAATRVYRAIKLNKQLPTYVALGNVRFDMSSFLEAMARTVINISNGKQSEKTEYYVRYRAEQSGESLTSGIIELSEYISVAENIVKYYEATNMAVSYADTSLGNMSFESLVLLYSNILASYDKNGTLAKTASVKPWGDITGTVLPAPIPTEQVSYPQTTPETETEDVLYISASDLMESAKRVKLSIETNKALPPYIAMGAKRINIPDFFGAVSLLLENIDLVNVPMFELEAPEFSAENLRGTSLSNEEYTKAIQRTRQFIEYNAMVPSFVSTQAGDISYEALIYIFTSLLAELADKGSLPQSINITSWSEMTGNPLPTPMPTSEVTPVPTPTPTPVPTVVPVPTAETSYNIEGDTFKSGAIGTNGAVSSSSAYSSKIGLDILKKGGNAVDAAVATMFAVGLCEPSGSSVGGGGLSVIYLKDQNKYLVFDYMAQTPKAVGSTSNNSNMMCIPGMVHGAISMLEKYGTMTLEEILNPVIDLARAGFIIDAEFVYRSTQLDTKYSYPTNLFTKDVDGNKLTAGAVVANPDLADTLELIRDGGIEAFYNSDFTDNMVSYLQSIGSTITKSDFQQYTSLEREPLTTTYRGYKVYAGSGTAQGGSRVVSMLNKMSNYPMSSYGHDSAQAVRTTAVGFGMTSRGSSLGVKEDLLNLLDDVVPYDNKTTTMLTTYDQWGNAVAANVTLGKNYGCSVAVPGTGFCFNSGMTTSTMESLSRVQSTMSPCIVANTNGKPMIIVGSPGDQAIITATAITISNILDFGMNVCQAVNAPRFFGYALTSSMTIETRYSASTLQTLRDWGYSLTTYEGEYSSGVGCVSAIHIKEDGTIMSAADHRREYMSFAY